MALPAPSRIGQTPEEDRAENQHRARRLLQRMDRVEDCAQRALGEEALPAPHLTAERIAYYQDKYQETYRDLVGVDPTQRALLRSRLEQVQQTGSLSLEEIVQQVRGDVVNARVLNAPPELLE